MWVRTVSAGEEVVQLFRDERLGVVWMRSEYWRSPLGPCVGAPVQPGPQALLPCRHSSPASPATLTPHHSSPHAASPTGTSMSVSAMSPLNCNYDLSRIFQESVQGHWVCSRDLPLTWFIKALSLYDPYLCCHANANNRHHGERRNTQMPVPVF